MSDPIFGGILNIGGGGIKEVMVNPSRVTQEEFEAAKLFTDVLWGSNGLAECLGPSWSLVHDPRFMKIEQIWDRATKKKGMFGGTVGGSTEDVQALDLASRILLILDPALYAEILGEGRHFRDVALKAGLDIRGICQDRNAIWRLIAQECPNYQRRDGSWNVEAERLFSLLEADLIGLIDDYTEVAYSQDWIRMDTGEVVRKTERIEDIGTGMNIPVIAVEVDSLHKAIQMRAMIRTTALRLMKNLPGFKPGEIEKIQLTDCESDKVCQLLFKVDYDKIYTVLPEILALLNRARALPLEDRERGDLKYLRQAAREFQAGLASGEIKPIVTSLEESDKPDIFNFLSQVQHIYNRDVYCAADALALKGDTRAAALLQALAEGGGTTAQWQAIEDYLTSIKAHPKQDVIDGVVRLDPVRRAEVADQFRKEIVVVGETGTYLGEAQVEQALEVYAHLDQDKFIPGIAQEVALHGSTATPSAMACSVREDFYSRAELSRADS